VGSPASSICYWSFKAPGRNQDNKLKEGWCYWVTSFNVK
jgi:hypothetical protein